MIRRSTRLFLVACEHLTECFYEGKLVSATEMSEKYNMNHRALRPALIILTRSGVLQSQTGGREPGYRFTRDPRDISLYDIILNLEGQNENPCCKDIVKDLKCSCDDKTNCAFYQTNTKIRDDFKKMFSNVPIAELFTRAK